MLSLLERRPDTHSGHPKTETLDVKVDVLRSWAQTLMQSLAGLLAGERLIDARTVARVWGMVADWLIMGGVLVVPVAAICATIGAIVPGNTPFHRHTAGMFAIAMLWFVASLLAAQFQRQRLNDRATE